MAGVNTLYVTATICYPGTQGGNQCATVDHMLLDTGSVGVRVLASALGSTLAGGLPAQTGATNDATGNAPIAQCAQFGSGYLWGAIKRADVSIGNESAGNLPVQIVSDSAIAVPDDCVKSGLLNLGTTAQLNANGVIGIGSGIRDFPAAAQTALKATYYYCNSSGSCTNTRVPLDTQMMNPVADFASDNNGTVISLPALPAGGQTTATGQLTFGVGTQSNNALPSGANIVPLDQNGLFTTVYKGGTFTYSTIDSGTNVYYFPDASIPNASGLYTPSAPLGLSATIKPSSGAGAATPVSFQIVNGLNVWYSTAAASDSLGAPVSGGFLWGLPFFYGRNIYTVLNNAKAGSQTGPFVAF